MDSISSNKSFFKDSKTAGTSGINTAQRKKWVLFLFPLALATIFLIIKMYSSTAYKFVVQEDTAIEWFQALSFFLAGAFSFGVAFKLWKGSLPWHSILFAALGAGLLFVAGEEISWGQRIFNIENTAFFEENNMQQEITLHNLEPVAPLLSKFYILIGLYGTFAWLLLAKTSLKNRIPFVELFIPDWFISSYFFFAFFIYAVLSYVRPFAVNVLEIEELRIGYFFIFRDQEPAELLLSMGFLLFTFMSYRKVKNMDRIRGTRLDSSLSERGSLSKQKDRPAIRDRRPVPGKKTAKKHS